MKILRATDKVKVKIGTISFTVSPLKQAQKLELTGMVKAVKDGGEVADIQARLSYVVKHCVKGVEGVLDFDDKPINVAFDDTGALTEDSHAEMMTVVNSSTEHLLSMMKIAGGQHPGEIVDMVTGKKLKGAEVVVNPKP
jgi:acylphosphatase